MSENLKSTASKLFTQYRKNYNVLKELYLKENIPFLPYVGCEIKFAGLPMSSGQMNGLLQDRTVHSCGSNIYSKNTESIFDPFNFKKHWTFTGEPTREQVNILNKIFDEIKFDLKKFRKSAAIKGFLIINLRDNMHKVVNYNYDKPGWENSLTNTTGDILAECSTNFLEAVDKILISSEFKTFGYEVW